eukprot:CAMPEP_0197640308 /NCGR_PEP_ID=MMETSP1338-20131121/14644_1 /TAXON_ID=43686 ORGANISM="Pelagodinium beii, Strain RCC1491" /NCGR_SAMPLE_ID=MMETSP1338 /ASSEMBLY_ACC=CAM_ASM_000754 /LENGTH=604 /DNA_ID=CAMNT_0043213145 /DNA_START=37 /DNA_END=1851 /DNA_ORIENTATION=-
MSRWHFSLISAVLCLALLFVWPKNELSARRLLELVPREPGQLRPAVTSWSGESLLGLIQPSGGFFPDGLLRYLVNATINVCEDYLKHHTHDNFTDPYPYWSFVPITVGGAGGYLLTGESMQAAPADACFKVNITAEYKRRLIPGFSDYVEIKIDASRLDAPCKKKENEDLYLISTLGDFTLIKVTKPGLSTHTVKVGKETEKAKILDTETRGVRVFHILGTATEAVWALLETVRLFEPMMGKPDVSSGGAAKNVDFLNKYAVQNITLRTGQINVDIPEDLIQDGDFFGLRRLDGLDPMLSWAMGSSTGHTTMAMRFDGVLHVVESTANSNYWPVNGVQKTEWKLWLERYRKADYAIVHMPLSAESRAKFNVSAAREAFSREYEGFDYGYSNMLFSWLDIVDGNFPCMPKEASKQGCLAWPVWELLVAQLERLDSSIAETMFIAGQRRRVGLEGGNWPEVLQAAYEKFGTEHVQKMVTLPEQDSWTYNTTRWGKAAVGPARMCDALVCSLWKAGGLFGGLKDEVQCAEFTNWDAYGLKLFDADWPSKRPQVCKDNDPDNDHCQLSGRYSLKLKTPRYTWNERDLVPHLAERCPSLAPKYDRPADC